MSFQDNFNIIQLSIKCNGNNEGNISIVTAETPKKIIKTIRDVILDEKNINHP